jgi:hypothetical protein
MILGGNGENEKQLKSVELFNWETGKHCTLENLPFGVAAHSGIVMNGSPVFCGGYLDSSRSSSWCHKYNIRSKEWEKVENNYAVVVFKG